MKDATPIHPLAQGGVKSGKIRFIHHEDGKEHEYYSVVNKMTGDRMSAFDDEPPNIGESLAEVERVYKSIRARATRIIEVIGDF